MVGNRLNKHVLECNTVPPLKVHDFLNRILPHNWLSNINRSTQGGFFCLHTHMRAKKNKSYLIFISDIIKGHWRSLKVTGGEIE